MRATRLYWASVSRSMMTISIWLLGFLLFSLLVGSLVKGSQGFNPQQVAVTKSTNETVLRPEIINGTTYYFNTTYTNTTTSYQDNCSGHHCDWWLNGLVLLLQVISLALIVLAFALFTWGVAIQESMYLRDSVARTGANNGIDVYASPFTFAWGAVCLVLGLFAVFVAVLIEIWNVTGKHSSFFIASVIILGVFAILMAIVMFLTLFRSEAPIALQSIVVPVPVQTGPVVYANNNNAGVANNGNVVNSFQPEFQPVSAQSGLSQSGAVPMETLGRRLSNLITNATSPRQGGHVYSPLRNRNVNNTDI